MLRFILELIFEIRKFSYRKAGFIVGEMGLLIMLPTAFLTLTGLQIPTLHFYLLSSCLFFLYAILMGLANRKEGKGWWSV